MVATFRIFAIGSCGYVDRVSTCFFSIIIVLLFFLLFLLLARFRSQIAVYLLGQVSTLGIFVGILRLRLIVDE
jgi:uncharacterized membrane protein (DUF485 family)